MDKDGKGAPLCFAGLAKDAMKANRQRRQARLAQVAAETQAEIERHVQLATEEEEEEPKGDEEEAKKDDATKGSATPEKTVGEPILGDADRSSPERRAAPISPFDQEQAPPEPIVPTPGSPKVSTGFPEPPLFPAPLSNPLVVIPLQVRAPSGAKKTGAGGSSVGASKVRGVASKPPLTKKSGAAPRRDLHRIKDHVYDFDRIQGESSFCSDDPPEGFTRFAQDIFSYTTPVALRRDFRSTPLEGIAQRLVRDLYLSGLRATELASRTFEFANVMQGRLPQEWLATFEREQASKDEEYKRVLLTIQEEKKKLDEERAEALKKSGECMSLLEGKDGEISRLQEEVARLRASLGAEEKEKKELKEQQLMQEKELRSLQGKLAEREDAALGAFLGSRAFETAALAGASVEMRRVLYGVTDALTEFWPFRPEEFKILEVSDNERAPDLRKFRWDRLNDRLVTMEGEILEPPSVCPDFSSFEQVKPENPWPMKYYPVKAGDNRLAQVIAAGEKALADAAAEASKEKKRKRTE